MSLKPPSPRAALIVMAGVCLLFGGAYAAAWSAGAAAMRKQIVLFADAPGPIAVDIGSLRTKGFPFFLRGEVRAVRIESGALAWRTPELAIDALPVNPRRFVFTSVNPQSLDLGRWGAYEIVSEGARASLERRGAGLVADAQADSIIAKPTRGAAGLTLKGVLFKAAPPETGSGALQASFFAGAFELSNKGRTAKGEKLLLDIVADGRREADIRRLMLETSGASVELHGVVTIDANGYPQGVLDAALKNPKGFAAFLADLGAIDGDESRAAGAALALAAIATGGEIRAPIELKEGAARIAGVKIAALPKIR